MFTFDTRYMKRALELAARGMGNTSPNPMVGAVIVHNDKIIGEGYHRLCGQAHAEVNAVNSVGDRSLLRDSTMYVTLEPCSHYGKTPPCARLIIECGIPRVVVGAVDPFDKVAGRGIAMLREAGVEVIDGVLADESRSLNARFFTAHTLRRPFITLKWAQSADGFMDRQRRPGQPAARFSNPLSTLAVHRLRSLHDAIVTTAATVNADNCRLNVRGWEGRQPRPVIIDRHRSLNPGATLLSGIEPRPLVISCAPADIPAVDNLVVAPDEPLDGIMTRLYESGITSVLVEAGPTLLRSFIDLGLWDLARVETAPFSLGDQGAHPAPAIVAAPAKTASIEGNIIAFYSNNRLVAPLCC